MEVVKFANLSVRFGAKELLDYKGIVASAFLVDTHVRNYGDTKYYFYEMKMDYLDRKDPTSLAIYGRFIKDTLLKREQVMEGGDLRVDPRSLPSAPSAFFTLFLADHRLAYIPESKGAPTLGNLEATIAKFIKDEYHKFMREHYDREKALNSKFTWEHAYGTHAPPTIKLVPLTSSDSIDRFIDRFDKIQRVTIHVRRRNQDFSGGNMFQSMYDVSEDMGASSAKYVVGGGPDGLNSPATKETVRAATESGYEEASISGVDQSGAKLNGSNEDFSLKVYVETEGTPDEQKALKSFEVYEAQKASGSIKVSPREKGAITKIFASLKAFVA